MKRSPLAVAISSDPFGALCRAGLGIALGALLAGVPGASATASGGVSVEGLLAGLTSRGAVNVAFGREPTRCLAVPRSGAAASELCEWQLVNRDAAWSDLANALDTEDRVGVICAFDLETGARKAETCTAYARRSNRDSMRSRGGYRKDKARRKAETERRAENRAAGVAALDAALHLDPLVRELGELPASCEPLGDVLVCTWPANGRTPGHGSVVASIDGDFSKRVRFTCRIPVDGSARAPGSCNAAIGK